MPIDRCKSAGIAYRAHVPATHREMKNSVIPTSAQLFTTTMQRAGDRSWGRRGTTCRSSVDRRVTDLTACIPVRLLFRELQPEKMGHTSMLRRERRHADLSVPGHMQVVKDTRHCHRPNLCTTLARFHERCQSFRYERGFGLTT